MSVSDIQEQCQKAKVAFFFKQWGEKQKSSRPAFEWKNL